MTVISVFSAQVLTNKLRWAYAHGCVPKEGKRMATKLDKTIVRNDNVSNKHGHNKARKDGGVIMRHNMFTAFAAIIALCALFCATGCTKADGEYGPAWSGIVDLSEACGVDTDSDGGTTTVPDWCDTGPFTIMTLSSVTDTTATGNDVVTEYTATIEPVSGSENEYVFAFAKIDSGKYSHRFEAVPDGCVIKMADGSEIPDTIEVLDLDPDAGENSMAFSMECEKDVTPPDIIVNVDGGMDPEDLCPWLTPTIKGKAFDGSQPVDSDATPIGATFTLSGPIEQLQATLGDNFSPTCTTTTENPTCMWDCLIPNNYYSITVTADGFEGVIWDNNGIDLEAGVIYDLQFPLSPSVDHPENSLVEFPGFNMAEGATMNAADMYFARYDADETAVPIPSDEATYEVVDGTSVTLEGGASDAGVDPISGDLAVLTAAEVGQTHIQRCWTGFEPNPCQIFTVTVY
jgi:hypothetical protein